MKSNYFEIIRGGLNSTFQDQEEKIYIILVYHLVAQWIKGII